MRILAIIVSAGALAGIAVYALFDALGLFGMLGNQVVAYVGTVVALFAVTGCGSAALALAFRAGFDHAERERWRQLEARLAKLESGRLD